ncbi:MAG TPA: hypothetical protein VH062_13615 [Polyangiaceae bacterium]|jgi:hypothetical protein|nr:hypothetical protein [Polyangiaceae bacterium]
MNKSLGSQGTKVGVLILAACSMLSAVGCGQASGADGKPDTGDTGRVLAKVERADGASVTFLEAEPGIVFVRERGSIDGDAFLPEGESRPKSVVDLYERLAGEAAPVALVDAVELSKSMKQSAARTVTEPDETVAPAAPATDGVGTASQALSNDLSNADFLGRYCPPSYPDTTDYFRWVNVSGRGSLTRSDQLALVSAVMGLQGTVHFVAKYRPWYTWKNLADAQVNPGWYERVDMEDTWTDFDARATVDESDGDLYNMCTHF